MSLALLLASCEARVVESGETAQETSRDEAAQTDSACEPVMFEDTPLTHCAAHPDRHTIRMVLAPGSAADDASERGEPFRSLAAYAAQRPANAAPVAFAMNGGMYDAEGHPVGYYVEDGERLQQLNRADGPGNFHMKPNGVFFGNAGGNWRVWNAQRFIENVEGRPEFGTQSGPMLVVAGELHPDFDPNGESLKIRNGVGVDEAGRAHFVISEAPISFGRFARYFRDVVRTPNALFLDGSVSQLWDPSRDRLRPGAPLGPLIIVEMREDHR